MPMAHPTPVVGAGPSIRSLPGPGGASGIISHTAPHISSMPHNPSGVTGQRLGMPRTIQPKGGSATSLVPNPRTAQPNVTAPQTRLNGQLATRQSEPSHNLVTRSLQGGGRAAALRNGTFASLATHHGAAALASTTFRGRFANLGWKSQNGGWFWRHRRPIIVIGWFGPLFWPYAYSDFVDYTFWPYAYDEFWPYAYDDFYVGMFGPYSYEGSAYSGIDPASASPRRVKARKRPAAAGPQVCQAQVPELTGWPIQQIAQTVQPDEAQRATLSSLKDAAGMALDVLQSACPDDLPSTPTGRLAAMRKRIEGMSQALAIVKPALNQFYDSLSDEQKARFNPIAPAAQSTTPARVANRPADLAQVCSGQAARPAMPSERIAQALHPSDAQRAALQMLDDASAKAADYLKANCAADEALTPPGRLAAMEQRLNAMLEAIKLVQPALESFYGSLTDEQKARFNQLGPPQV
jgi:hypothetical protein